MPNMSGARSGTAAPLFSARQPSTCAPLRLKPGFPEPCAARPFASAYENAAVPRPPTTCDHPCGGCMCAARRPMRLAPCPAANSGSAVSVLPLTDNPRPSAPSRVPVRNGRHGPPAPSPRRILKRAHTTCWRAATWVSTSADCAPLPSMRPPLSQPPLAHLASRRRTGA